jgi:hypothetical protein
LNLERTPGNADRACVVEVLHGELGAAGNVDRAYVRDIVRTKLTSQTIDLQGGWPIDLKQLRRPDVDGRRDNYGADLDFDGASRRRTPGTPVLRIPQPIARSVPNIDSWRHCVLRYLLNQFRAIGENSERTAKDDPSSIDEVAQSPPPWVILCRRGRAR